MRLLALACWIVPLTGCVTRPVVELSAARIAAVSPYGVEMAMRVRVNNTSPFDVRVRNVRVQVTIADKYALPYVRFNPDRWMPANSWSYIEVPALIPWQTIKPLAATTLGNETIPYHVAGYVDVTATRLLGIAINDHEIDDDASVSRADLLMAAMRGTMQPMTPRASGPLLWRPR
jgi:LEA14-like dessication related protein